MKNFIKKLSLISACLFMFISNPVTAQQKQDNGFWKEVQAINARTKAASINSRPTIIVGSSSVRMWPELEQKFAEYGVLQHGFGGSKLNDLSLFADDLITSYNPKQVVVYCGDNDLADQGISAEIIFSRFEKLFNQVRNKLPHVPIAFMSIKPSPSRAQHLATVKRANALIRDFLNNRPLTDFIDIYTPMLDQQGQPQKDLFAGDMLHMNKLGYAIWDSALEPYLLK